MSDGEADHGPLRWFDTWWSKAFINWWVFLVVVSILIVVVAIGDLVSGCVDAWRTTKGERE